MTDMELALEAELAIIAASKAIGEKNMAQVGMRSLNEENSQSQSVELQDMQMQDQNSNQRSGSKLNDTAGDHDSAEGEQMPGLEGDNEKANGPSKGQDGNAANLEVGDEPSIDLGFQDPVGEQMPQGGNQLPQESYSVDLYEQEDLTLSVKYKTKWQNLVFFLFAIGLFSGLSFIKNMENLILWIILILLLLLNTAAIFDFFSSPTWVRYEANRIAGSIKLTSQLRSCFHTYEVEKRTNDLLDVVVKTNYMSKVDKDDTPEVLGHTIVLVFKNNQYLHFNINLDEFKDQNFQDYIRKLDDFHFNGTADRCSDVKNQDFTYYKIGTVAIFTFAFILNCILFLGIDYLVRQETKRVYSFMSPDDFDI